MPRHCGLYPGVRGLEMFANVSDYLQTVFWFECSAKTKLINNPQESDKNYNLQFVDWVAHCVWSHFEDGETVVFSEISKQIKQRQLFF